MTLGIDYEGRPYPEALAAVLAEPFEYEEGDGIDLEAFGAFLSAAETTQWLRAWTGHPEAAGDLFRVFAMDGTGGYAACWLVEPGRELDGQPVVFLGSEGETGVVARDLGEFLWLLADGLGPAEAVEEWRRGPRTLREPRLREAAERFAPGRGRPAPELLELARRRYPDFEALVEALCEPRPGVPSTGGEPGDG